MTQVKPGGGKWTIQEQVVDIPGGIDVQFEIAPDGTPRLRLFSPSLPFGNFEIAFDESGHEAGGGCYTGKCRPAWIGELS